jgi:DNA repair exonuclease SbcCD ATPase subunit
LYLLGRLSRRLDGPPLTLRLPPKAARASEIGLALPTGCCYHAGMNERKNEGSTEGTSGWVNTDVAAEALGVSARSVRNYILDGALVARKEKEGINERYVVSVDSLYALRDRRKHEGKSQRNFRRASRRAERSAEGSTELVRETAVDMLRETLASLETHISQNAELRARLELTERAESTLREELERERQERLEAQGRAGSLEQERSGTQQRVTQLTQEHAELEEEHSRLQSEAEQLREDLGAERSKGFWARLFGR